jgi:hypothetical protein
MLRKELRAKTGMLKKQFHKISFRLKRLGKYCSGIWVDLKQKWADFIETFAKFINQLTEKHLFKSTEVLLKKEFVTTGGST